MRGRYATSAYPRLALDALFLGFALSAFLVLVCLSTLADYCFAGKSGKGRIQLLINRDSRNSQGSYKPRRSAP